MAGAPADGVSWSHDQVPLADRLAATMVLFLILLLLSITVALILTRRAVTVLRTASTGTVPTATLAEARSPDSWDGARPLATAIDGLDDATAVWQLSKLREARQLVAHMRDAKAQSSDVLEFAFVSPDENSSLTFSLAFMPDGDVIISERARGFPLGFLPYFSLIREVDLLPSLLPPVIARPLEELSIRHRFANNDLMYHVRARFRTHPRRGRLFLRSPFRRDRRSARRRGARVRRDAAGRRQRLSRPRAAPLHEARLHTHHGPWCGSVSHSHGQQPPAWLPPNGSWGGSA